VRCPWIILSSCFFPYEKEDFQENEEFSKRIVVILNGTVVCVLAAVFLVTAAVLVKGTWRRRRLAILSAISAAGVPWLAPADVPLLRGGLAVWTTWSLGRVIDLVSELHDRSFAARLWHIFGLIDTRQTTWASPAVDIKALGKTFAYAVLAIAGLMIAIDVAPSFDGTWYWYVRWLGGALFFYSLADAVEGGVRTLYRAAGIVVPRQHVLPIVSRSVQEFWGKRWNRAVGAWLRMHCFLPFARRQQIRTGLAAAFCASAVFHAYFTWVAVGGVMALAMVVFFLIQGVCVLLELWAGVARWNPLFAHLWTVVAVLGCSPLFIEPLLRILHV